MRIVYLGTSPFGIPSLEALRRDGHSLELIVTSPDKPRGRDRKLSPTPVGRWAIEHGLPLTTAGRADMPAVEAQVAALRPDALVVIAYGVLLPETLLRMPRLFALNVHASILPSWRGAAPIQRAILSGDRTTGVSIMRMTRGLDEGPVLCERALAIATDETLESLEARLAEAGAEALTEVLAAAERGCPPPERPQDHPRATLARKITKDEGVLDWTGDAEVLARRVRALSRWPGCEARWAGRRFLLYDASPVDAPPDGRARPGTVLGLDESGRLRIACGKGELRIGRLQAEGKQPVRASDWLNGYRVTPGTSFD